MFVSVCGSTTFHCCALMSTVVVVTVVVTSLSGDVYTGWTRLRANTQKG